MNEQADGLAEFLLARIAEDEFDALDHYSSHEDGSNVEGAPCVLCGGEHPCRTRRRLMAECEAKRRIVEADRIRGQEAGVRSLASVYADHPDYREEWRP